MLACKLISRQLHTQYVKGIYRPNYPVTLKYKGYSRTGHYGNGTIEYITSYLTSNIIVTLKSDY